MIELALKFWCRHFHRKVMRPVHGKYACATCLRVWPVPWEHRHDPRVASRRQLDVYTEVVTPPSDPFPIAPVH